MICLTIFIQRPPKQLLDDDSDDSSTDVEDTENVILNHDPPSFEDHTQTCSASTEHSDDVIVVTTSPSISRASTPIRKDGNYNLPLPYVECSHKGVKHYAWASIITMCG